MTIIFDGERLAAQKLTALRSLLHLPPSPASLSSSKPFLTIAALVFQEDAGGQLYTRKKAELASQLNISYQPTFLSLHTDISIISDWIEQQNSNSHIDGIIIQKPMRTIYEGIFPHLSFSAWWQHLVTRLSPAKDIDGLNPATTSVIPATAAAVISILTDLGRIKNNHWHSAERVVIIGQSDLLGVPLFNFLSHLPSAPSFPPLDVELWGKKSLAAALAKHGHISQDIIISATGTPNLITGHFIKAGAVLIDVGEPKGDVDVPSVLGKASLLTPVPHGVGPLTVISLMENTVKLASK